MVKTVQEQLDGFIDDLVRSLSFDIGKTYDCDNIILCGMGGSAISGVIATDCCMEKAKKPIAIIKTPIMPKWVNERTLAIISSYSGNTAETVELYKAAKERGCTIVTQTSGGVLEKYSVRDGYDTIKLPDDMHPRHCIGYMIGYTLSLFKSAGCVDMTQDIIACVDSLRAYMDKMKASGILGDLCRKLNGKVPVICSGYAVQTSAFRMRSQFNENSKLVAFCCTTGDFKYSSMDVWMSNKKRKEFALILLSDKVNTRYYSEIKERTTELGISCINLEFDCKSILEDAFISIILGDSLSIEIAKARGIEPSEVPAVRRLKDDYLVKRKNNVDGTA